LLQSLYYKMAFSLAVFLYYFDQSESCLFTYFANHLRLDFTIKDLDITLSVNPNYC